MKVKEQLAIYMKAIEVEEKFRVEINAKIDARLATIQGLIDGTKKLIALGEAAESELPTDVEEEPEESEPSKKLKPSKSVTKKNSKKTPKVFTKATGVPVKGKKGAEAPRPRLADSMQIVMGGRELSATEIHAELKNRHWVPDSKDPLGYIRYALSANPSIFLRRESVRGKYHLDKNNPYTVGKHKGPIEGYANPKSKKNSKENPIVLDKLGGTSTTKPTTTLLVQGGQQEDSASVVADLLKDGGLKAFGRQAAPLLETS